MVEGIYAAYAGILKALDTFSAATRPAWRQGLNDVIAAMPALKVLRETCKEAGERAWALLRYVAEDRRRCRGAAGGGKWGPMLDAQDAQPDRPDLDA